MREHLGTLARAGWELGEEGDGFVRLLAPRGIALDAAIAEVTLGDEARLLDAGEVDERAQLFLEIPGEHVREPLGPLGPFVRGVGLTPALDMVEHAGGDTAGWLARTGLDRGRMLDGALVPWDDARGLFELVPIERLADECRVFARYTSGVRQLVKDMPLDTILPFLSGASIEPAWGPLGPCRAYRVRERVVVVRLPVRAGVAGAHALLATHAATLESLATHVGPEPARTRAFFLDPEATGGTYVVDLPFSLPKSDVPAFDRDEQARQVVSLGLRSRRDARIAAVERIAGLLSSYRESSELAEHLGRVFEELGAVGVDIRFGAAEAPSAHVVRGPQVGRPLSRTLRAMGEALGQVTLFTDEEHVGDVLSALDLVEPWLSTALSAAAERAARRAAEAREVATTALVVEILEAHPNAVFVVAPDGRVEPANERATRALGADPTLLSTIALALEGGPSAGAFDVLPVEVDGALVRTVVVVRGGTSLSTRIESAAERWKLTRRQREVVHLVVRGMTNKEIARSLGSAEVTVETHLTAVYRKAAVVNRAQLIAALAT